MEVMQGYKETEVGVIPSDWEVLKLGEICSFENGDRSSNYPAANEFVSNGIPFINAGHVSDGIISLETMDYIPDSVFNRLSGGKVLSGDILFCLRGSLGKFGLVSSDFGQGAIASSLVIIRPKLGRTTTLYLSSYFKSEICKRMIEFWAGGAAQPNLGAKELEKFLIPLSSKAEQTAIATALNDADALITQLEKLIAKKRAIKQGAMQELLKPKDGWEVKKLGEIAEIVMGQSPLSKFYNAEGKGLPLIQGNADVNNRKTIIRSFTSFITKRGKVSDIIMSVRAPVGEISKATFDCCLGRGVCAIRFRNEYLYHYLIFFENSWAKFSTGSTFDSVNSAQVKDLEIPIPKSHTEQTRIAKILSDMEAEMEALEKKLDKYKMLKQGMMQNLLTGRIRLV